MWITRVQLSNIKSYGQNSPAIEFRQGVNLIQGKNGAGKSTILEAIGLALFDSRTYTHQQFVREGSRSGTITVAFVSGWDEREYEVVRGVGGGQTYVYDPETSRKVCEGKEDTLEFIRRHLRVEPGTELEALFRDAVGVPQGTITAIFHETPSTRKEKFNRLLRIDSYERAWEALRSTGNYIRQRSEQNDLRRAELSGMLEGLPDVAEQIEHLERLIGSEQEALEETRHRLEQVNADVQALDSRKQQLDALDWQISDLQAELQVLEERLSQATEVVEEAEAAAEVAAETEEAYRLHQRAQETLQALEAKRQQRDILVEEHHELDTQCRLCRQDLERLAGQLREIQDAEAAVERLAPLVERQQSLAKELEQAKQDLAEYERLQQEIAQYDGVLADLAGRLRQIEEQVATEDFPKEEVAGEFPSGRTLEEQSNIARERVLALQSAYQGWADAHASWQSAQQEVQALQQQIQERERLQHQLVALDQDWADTTRRDSELRSRVAQIERQQQTIDEYRTLLSQADARCPVCQRPMDEHARAESEAHFAAERQALDEALQEAREQLEALVAEQKALEEERASLAQQIERLPGEASLNLAQARLDEAQAVTQERQDELARHLAGATGAQDALAALLSQARERTQALAATEQRLSDIQQTLVELGDVQRQYDRVKARAEERPTVEARQAERQAELAEQETHLGEIEAELQQFADLDKRIAQAQETRSSTEADYQRYLASRDIAAQLASRRANLKALHEEREARAAQHEQLKGERNALATGYDPEAHEVLRQQQRELEKRQVELHTRLEGYQERRREFIQEKERLQKVQQELEQCEREAERLQARQEAFAFMRESIRQAGPRIARQLTRLIAERANHIFGDILGDYSLVLNWSDDYAISVSYRGEERDFELLSGGEQMAAALAIRLALLTQLANVQFAFFDEPTTNLDEARRRQLAESLAAIRSLQQIFVISHDDTFEQDSYHVIQVYKENGLSQVEMQ